MDTGAAAPSGVHTERFQRQFCVCQSWGMPRRELFEALRQNHIYVRYFDKPRIDNYLRITIGTQKEMEKLVDFLETYLKKRKER